jgi:heptosyltransferase I
MGSMGDVIHALPAVATLKHSLPGSCVCWVIDPKWACLLEGNPFVDEIIPFDRHSSASFKSAWHSLRSRRYRLAVDFQGLIKSALAASVALPDRLFGFHQSQVRERLAALFYSNRVLAQSAHVVDRNLELAAAAGAPAILTTFPLPEGTPEGELPSGDFVLANPLAGWPGKQWPLGDYAMLARLLRTRLNMPLVLNGPPQAAELLGRVSGVAVHVSGIPGLIHATRKARAVLGIDSGPVHLAAALDKPGVAIFGPTDPARNGPYGKSFIVLRDAHAVTTYKRRQEPDPSMSAISPERVVAALEEVIAGRGLSAGRTT